MGIKVKECVVGDDNRHYSWVFVCPACKSVHECDERWLFNGNREAPTFGPLLKDGKPCSAHSVLVNGNLGNPGRPRCHSFVTDGKITYVGDSTHAFAGQTLDIPDWDSARELGGAEL